MTFGVKDIERSNIELFAGIGSQREALKRTSIEHKILTISEND